MTAGFNLGVELGVNYLQQIFHFLRSTPVLKFWITASWCYFQEANVVAFTDVITKSKWIHELFMYSIQPEIKKDIFPAFTVNSDSNEMFNRSFKFCFLFNLTYNEISGERENENKWLSNFKNSLLKLICVYHRCITFRRCAITISWSQWTEMPS